MNRPWTPERHVDVALATRLIETLLPALAPVSAHVLGEGWDNIVFLVNERIVFRFPRRQIAVPLLETETRLLPAIASRLPLPVSAPTHVGVPTEDYPWPFAGYPMIPGRTPDRVAPTEARRAVAAAPLGGFLRALHAIPVAKVRALGLEDDTMGRLDAPRRLQLMTERARVISTRGGPDVQRFVDAANALDPRPARCIVPVHGDLHVWQLLIDDDGRPTGVIDWGDTHVGDPALDLSIALCYLPPGARVAFRDAYGPIDAATWALARFRAIFIAIALLDYGQDVGDEMLVRESLRELEYAIR